MNNYHNILKSLDEYICKGMEDWNIPGLAVGIVNGKDIILSKGYGFLELNKPEKVDGDSLFAIASNTKAFTAAALGKLVHEKYLSWDDPVIKFLPDFKMYDYYATQELRIRDLLCHRSGLGTWAGDLMSYGSVYRLEEIIHRIRYVPNFYSFRSKYGYSNLMFLTAGYITEKISGMKWDEFIQKNIFDDLGMKNSNTSIKKLKNLNNVAVPHTATDTGLLPIPYRNIDNTAPAGAINSSVNDVAKWLKLFLNKGKINNKIIIDEDSMKEMMTPHTIVSVAQDEAELFPQRHFVTYGLGWFIADFHGKLIVYHGGALDGMLSYSGFLPEEDLGLVVLTNKYPHRFMTALFYHMIELYIDKPTKNWSQAFLDREKKLAQKKQEENKVQRARVEGTKMTLPLSSYAGLYDNKLYGTITIKEIDGSLKLYLSAHPGITAQLEHWHYDTFYAHWSDAVFDKSYIPFILNDGKVEEFRMKVLEDFLDPLEYRFIKK